MRVLIAGGGTGGHLFPGIAIADEFRRRGNHPVLFVGTTRGIESRAVPAAGYELATLEISGIKRMGLMGTLRGLFRLPLAVLNSIGILWKFRPDVVLGVGGYASGPLVFTAALLGYPTAIQEQNSVPGITNRALAFLVRKIFIAFDQAADVFPRKKIERLGNPVRQAIVEALSAPPRPANARPCVLIVGGSQGAKAVSDLVLGSVEILRNQPNFPHIVHQTGAADADRVKARYAELNVDVEVRPFIDTMAEAYKQADLVIGRAGALTLAELALAARPAILIPLPTAADDHQTKNAQQLATAGAAILLNQRTSTSQDLATAIQKILGDQATQASMSAAMQSLAKPTATNDIVDRLEKLARR